jgi:hypothetical protein
MRKVKLAGAGVIAAMLAALLLPAPAASAASVSCVDDNFVHVTWHPSGGVGGTACFAGAGKNWFAGVQGYSSWMSYLHTGNNDITFVDCNGSSVDFPRGTDRGFDPPWCVAWINIKPY